MVGVAAAALVLVGLPLMGVIHQALAERLDTDRAGKNHRGQECLEETRKLSTLSWSECGACSIGADHPPSCKCTAVTPALDPGAEGRYGDSGEIDAKSGGALCEDMSVTAAAQVEGEGSGAAPHDKITSLMFGRMIRSLVACGFVVLEDASI